MLHSHTATSCTLQPAQCAFHQVKWTLLTFLWTEPLYDGRGTKGQHWSGGKITSASQSMELPSSPSVHKVKIYKWSNQIFLTTIFLCILLNNTVFGFQTVHKILSSIPNWHAQTGQHTTALPPSTRWTRSWIRSWSRSRFCHKACPVNTKCISNPWKLAHIVLT